MASALPDSAVELIGIRGRKFTRIVVLAGLVACFAAVTGCGGDDDTDATTTPTVAETETAPAQTEATETVPEGTTETQSETEPPAETSPESMPGGAGD